MQQIVISDEPKCKFSWKMWDFWDDPKLLIIYVHDRSYVSDEDASFCMR